MKLTNYLLAALTILVGSSLVAKDMTSDEVDFKADFIAKVFNFVTWPEGAEKSSDGKVTIGVLGDSPLVAKLGKLVASKKIKDAQVVVKQMAATDDLTDCQILFITTEEKSELAAVLKKVQGKPVLTISDAYYFARYGVMVNFFKEESKGEEKVKFEVNKITLDMAGLKMSSKLLKLATLI